ncbi:ATPase, T2SS/T4P/T4SS family, partial [Klebsiella pneumoniae]|uniref:ATPase, T2SS/T4P/T4SS family n=1 Tax=Klebsiella pneumoniae TaxID=573 RepID=UPI001933C4C6
ASCAQVTARQQSVPTVRYDDNLPIAAKRDEIKKALAEHQVLVIAGETGSGKTTTLYASLNSLNDGSRNILTVEDPVEYAIAGIGQTAINPRAGL